jgi:hypothetical protein
MKPSRPSFEHSKPMCSAAWLSFGSTPAPTTLLSWRSRRLPLSGYLDPEQRHHYSFHGIGVCLQLAPELHIDWDFGHAGRMDGFDHWRLQQFLDERPELQQILPLASLQAVFDTSILNGSIVSPWRAQHDSLYYVADDLQPTAIA